MTNLTRCKLHLFLILALAAGLPGHVIAEPFGGYVLSGANPNTGQSIYGFAWLTGNVNGDGITEVIHPWTNAVRLGMVVYSPVADSQPCGENNTETCGRPYTKTWGVGDIGEGSGALSYLTGDVKNYKSGS